MTGLTHGWLVTLVARLGVLVLVVGMGLADEVEAGWRQVCTQSCDHTSGEAYWQCRRGYGAISSCEKVWFESHGALAYSRETGAYGYAYDHDSQNRARHAALGHCRRHASDCHIVVTFVEQCGAIAETAQRKVSYGLGKTRKEAEERSLAACRTGGGKACTVAAWACAH